MPPWLNMHLAGALTGTINARMTEFEFLMSTSAFEDSSATSLVELVVAAAAK